MKLVKYLLSILVLTLFVVACSEDSGDGDGIKLKDTPKEITFYADGENVGDTRGITFTATGNWAAIATDQLPTYSRTSVDWIKISPSSGGAGTYTITITLEVNTTGNDRTAYIMINCEGTDIVISITQKATNANDETLQPERVQMRPINRISYQEETPSDYEGVYAVDFKYDTQGRMSEMWCHSKGYYGDPDRTDIWTMDYSIADELRISNSKYGTWYVNLDKQGRATQAHCPQSNETYKFSYNAAGRLIEVDFSDMDDYGYNESFNAKFAYTEGLMTGFEQREDSCLYFKEDYNMDKLYPYRLMNDASNYDLNALMLFDLWSFGEEIVAPLYLMRYLGNTENSLYMQIQLDDDNETMDTSSEYYFEPNTTYNESYTTFSYGLTTDAEYVFDDNSPISISWNTPFTKTVRTWTVTTGDQLIILEEPHLGYQYTVSNRQTKTTEFDGLHKYTISYK